MGLSLSSSIFSIIHELFISKTDIADAESGFASLLDSMKLNGLRNMIIRLSSYG